MDRKAIMKDIDFLPEWYKSGVRREVSYRTQYIALGGVFLVMTVWSLVATRSIAKARAAFDDKSAIHAQAQKISAQLAGTQNEVRSLQQRVESIEQIDSRIDVASVLAELSFLNNSMSYSLSATVGLVPLFFRKSTLEICLKSLRRIAKF